MAQLNHEPSMEDILASIKRIIAEDGEPPAPRPPRTRRDTASATGTVAAEAEPEVEDVVEEPSEATSAIDPAPEPEADLLPPTPAEPTEPAYPVDILELTSPIAESYPRQESTAVMDPLMSDPAAQASRSAFAALTQLQVRAEAGQENTLEGLVTDLLRPMLREWLDRELPALVERMVAAEIGRISGRG